MKKSLLARLVLVMASLMLLGACATTQVTAVWKDQGFQGRIKQVAVVGSFRSPAVRNTFEDYFVWQLRAHGVEAVAGYTFIPSDKLRDKAFIMSGIKKAGMDSVLFTRLLDRKTVQSYVPGQVYAVPDYYRHWGPYFDYIYTPGYIVEEEVALAETNVYETAGEKLIWTARSETELIRSNTKLIESFVDTMIDRMASDGLIP